MSAVSGLNAKAEKGRSKYVALDINSIYKGKSLENPKATGKWFLIKFCFWVVYYLVFNVCRSCNCFIFLKSVYLEFVLDFYRYYSLSNFSDQSICLFSWDHLTKISVFFVFSHHFTEISVFPPRSHFVEISVFSRAYLAKIKNFFLLQSLSQGKS